MQMDPQVKVLDAVAPDAVAAAAAVAGATGGAVAEHPIKQVLIKTCDVTLLTSCMTFTEVEGLDSLFAFSQLNGGTNVTEIAKCMASRSIAAGGGE